MIKNILIDLDDTLFDFKKAEADAISKTFLQFGMAVGNTVITHYSEINDMMWEKLEKGEVTREQVLLGRFEILFGELGIYFNASDFKKRYEKNLGTGHVFVKGAQEFLQKAHEKYKLYLVSNGTASVQKGRLESSGIEKYFEKIFISQTVGFNKPDIRFFEKVFDSIADFKKEQTVIVGDSLSSDIMGGKNAGIKTIWFNLRGEKQSELPDYTATDLEQVLNIVSIC